jgi:organic radical activating enzyme
LNKKELLKIGQCEVEYATSKHISAETLYKIIDYIVNIDTVDLSRVEMEVYQLKQLNNAGTIYKKEMIIGDINNSRVIFGDDSTEKIAYLRGLTGDSPTDYDRYFEYNGKQAKISQNIDLDWKDKSILEGTK